MKRILFVLSIVLISNSFADDNKALIDKAKDVSRLIWDKADELTADQVKDIDAQFDKIVETVNEVSASKNVACVESSQQAGKYCFKYLTGDNSCLGNYFSSSDACNSSKAAVHRDHACFESKDSPGKGVLAVIASSIVRIGNYYSTFDTCVSAMSVARDGLACMESESKPGKFYILNFENPNQAGVYFPSLEECKRGISGRS